MAHRIGNYTVGFDRPPRIVSYAAVGGKKEAEGPLGKEFDRIFEDPYLGKATFELAESELQRQAFTLALNKGNLTPDKIQCLFAGDLLNQCVGSTVGLSVFEIPHVGIYGACSTMAESLLLSSMAVGGGFADNAVAMTSSHFASSERQYRFPLGYGGQRTPTAQWTVTGSGAALVCSQGTGPKITACTIGSVTDLGIQDANNMGAAMAPAAFATIRQHLQDLQRTPEDYDLIVTGDLGQYGKELLLEMGRREGLSLGGKLADCGCMVFDNTKQDVHAGGSGCGCSAITLCGHLLGELSARKLKRILFCGTGALLSPTSTQQGLPIPGVCHAVVIEGG